MFSQQQHTVAQTVCLEGVGLHTGRPARVHIRPSDDGEIVFVRDGVRVPARVDLVSRTARCTMLGEGDAGVSTVEHLLATLAALGITSAEIHLDGPEIPIRDGSASDFVACVLRAGARPLPGVARTLRLSEPVWVSSDDGSHLLALPGEAYRVTVAVEYPHPLIGRQTADFPVNAATFEREIAPARTFGFEHELEELARRGLALGGSIENALVYMSDHTTTPLRFPDEPARHKALDVIGDLALTGAWPMAHIVAVRPSHRMNVALARALLQHGTLHEADAAS